MHPPKLLSALLLVGLAAIARAEPAADSRTTIKDNLAKAQAALDKRDLFTALEDRLGKVLARRAAELEGSSQSAAEPALPTVQPVPAAMSMPPPAPPKPKIALSVPPPPPALSVPSEPAPKPKPNITWPKYKASPARPHRVIDLAASAPLPAPVPVEQRPRLKLLGYYAQDEDGHWVWLPVHPSK